MAGAEAEAEDGRESEVEGVPLTMVAFGTAKGTDMGTLGTMEAGAGEADVEIDTDFFVIGCADAVVGNFGPGVLPISEFGERGWVGESGMSTFGTDNAGGSSRVLSPAGLKGLAGGIVSPFGGVGKVPT